MKLSVTIGALALLALGGIANAADLYNSSGSTKDSPTVLGGGQGSQIVGFYGEIAVGPLYSSNTIDIVSTSASLSSDGGVVNGRVGYDYKFPSARFGVGAWGEVGTGFDASGKIGSGAGGITWSENLTWGAGGKIFYDHGLGQLYVIAGYAEADESVPSTTGPGNTTKTLSGWEWGTGISLELVGRVYGKMEYDQIIYNSESLGTGAPVKWSQVDNRVLFGLGFSTGQAFSPIK